ncbi:hypothetical protein VTL71DRAFT_3265 [Oculimacula yallundae]|uniref:Transmembrane protein n=1 Tax=Oculimacula yallundae TaxID=86028 RepID=A0ABR4C6M5_9HELO
MRSRSRSRSKWRDRARPRDQGSHQTRPRQARYDTIQQDAYAYYLHSRFAALVIHLLSLRVACTGSGSSAFGCLKSVFLNPPTFQQEVLQWVVSITACFFFLPKIWGIAGVLTSHHGVAFLFFTFSHCICLGRKSARLAGWLASFVAFFRLMLLLLLLLLLSRNMCIFRSKSRSAYRSGCEVVDTDRGNGARKGDMNQMR